MDSFEIYVYSLHISSMKTTYILARLVIAIELILGAILLAGIYTRKSINLLILLLGGFTLFLLFRIIQGSEEHCHCMGELIEISHPWAIARNLLIILCLFYIRKAKDLFFKFRISVLIIILLSGLLVPFVITPPDSFIQNKTSTYNDQALKDFLSEQELDDDRLLLCFYGTSCRFCKLAARKISVINEKSPTNGNMHLAFLGSSDQISDFIEETGTKDKNNITTIQLKPKEFLEITNGKMPLILHLENGNVIEHYGYRNISEKALLQFFRQENQQQVEVIL